MIYDSKAWRSTDEELKHIYQGTLFTWAFPQLTQFKLTLLAEMNISCFISLVFFISVCHTSTTLPRSGETGEEFSLFGDKNWMVRAWGLLNQARPSCHLAHVPHAVIHAPLLAS